MVSQPNKVFYDNKRSSARNESAFLAAAHKATGGMKGVIAGGVTGGKIFIIFLSIEKKNKSAFRFFSKDFFLEFWLNVFLFLFFIF